MSDSNNPVIAIQVSAETQALTQALQGLTKQIDGLKNSTVKASKEMKEGLSQGIGKGMDELQGKVMAVAAALKFKESFDGMLKLANDTKIIASQMGITANQAGLYALTLNRLGSGAEEFLSISGKLQQKIEKNGDAFRQYGIEIQKNGKFKDQVQVLQDIITKYDAMEGSSAKASMGNALLGKSFQTALPLLREFFEHAEATNNLFKRFGIDIDFGKFRDMAEENEIKWKDFETILNVIKIKVGNEILPILTKLGATLTNVVGKNLDNIILTLKQLTTVLSNGATVSAAALGALVIAIRAVWAALGPMAWAITGISLLAGAFDYLSTKTEREINVAQQYNEKLLGNHSKTLTAIEDINNMADKVTKLDKAKRDSIPASDKYKKNQEELDKLGDRLINQFPEYSNKLKKENDHYINIAGALKDINKELTEKANNERRAAELHKETLEKESKAKWQALLDADKANAGPSWSGNRKRLFTDEGQLTDHGTALQKAQGEGSNRVAINQALNIPYGLQGLFKEQQASYKMFQDASHALVKMADTTTPGKSGDGGSTPQAKESFEQRLEKGLVAAMIAAQVKAKQEGKTSIDQIQVRKDYYSGVKTEDKDQAALLSKKLAEVEKDTGARELKIDEKKLDLQTKLAENLQQQIEAQAKLVQAQGDPEKKLDAEAKLEELKKKNLTINQEIFDLEDKADSASKIMDLDIRLDKMTAYEKAGLIDARELLRIEKEITAEKLKIRLAELDSRIDKEQDPKKRAELHGQRRGLQDNDKKDQVGFSTRQQGLNRDSGKDFKGFFTSIKNDLRNNVKVWDDWGRSIKGVLSSLRQSMSSNLSAMLKGNVTFKDGVKAVWSSVADSALNALSEMMIASLEAQAIEMLWPSVNAATAASKVSADAATTASTAAKIPVETTETSVGMMGAISKIFGAHASIPFVGPLIAIALIALMMAAFKSNSGAVTGRATGGVITGPTLLAEKGFPEVVAPEKNFVDYTHALLSGDMSQFGGKKPGNVTRSNVKAIQPIQVAINAPNGIIGGKDDLGKYLTDILNRRARSVGRS